MQNNNKKGLDMPTWEQLPFAPATGIAGTNLVDDGEKYIYTYFQTSTTAAQFWVYDTWNFTWQQLATPATQTGTVSNMTYVDNIGGQFSGVTHGAVYLFVGNGTTCYFYKYDIATNTWSANLGTTNVSATFATDAYLLSMSPNKNNHELYYHSGTTRAITTSSATAVGVTTIAVSATSEAMPIGTRLRFGSFNITIGANASIGATSLSVSALPQGLAAGTQLKLANGQVVGLSTAASAGATSLSIFALQQPIANGTVITVEQYVVLTSAAASGATSLTVSAVMYSIASGSIAGYYGNLYLVGNNATTLYRYNLGAATWSSTTANAGNAAFPAIPGAVGAGCAIKWLSAFEKDKLWILRGGNTSNVYIYDLVTNTITSETYYPTTEAFTTGTSVASRNIGKKQGNLLIQKDGTYRIYEGIPFKNRMEPKITQYLYPASTAVVGDKSCCMRTPDGVEYYYNLLHSSAGFVRTALLDS